MDDRNAILCEAYIEFDAFRSILDSTTECRECILRSECTGAAMSND